jgi:hypothetical protein
VSPPSIRRLGLADQVADWALADHVGHGDLVVVHAEHGLGVRGHERGGVGHGLLDRGDGWVLPVVLQFVAGPVEPPHPLLAAERCAAEVWIERRPVFLELALRRCAESLGGQEEKAFDRIVEQEDARGRLRDRQPGLFDA